jgi:predicted transcriptional regulator
MDGMDRDGANQLPVMTEGRVVGLLTREDVVSDLRTLQELRAQDLPCQSWPGHSHVHALGPEDACACPGILTTLWAG